MKKLICIAVFIAFFALCCLCCFAQGSTAPVISYNDTPVTGGVSVSVSAPEGYTLSENDIIRYRFVEDDIPDVSDSDEGEWLDYSAPFTVDDNVIIEARIFYAEAEPSESAFRTVDCIDKTAPLPPEIIADTSVWVKVSLQVELRGGSDTLPDGASAAASDSDLAGVSGIRRLEYRLGADGVWTEYAGVLSVSSPITVYARSVDMAGNISQAVSMDITNFDCTAPDVSGLSVSFASKGAPIYVDSGTFGKYFRDNVTVSIDGAKDTESGLSGYQYQFVGSGDALDDNKWLSYDPSNLPVVSKDFGGYVYVRALDNVGNFSAAVASEGFVLDRTPPVIADVKLSETKITGSRVVITFSVTDNFWLESVTVNGIYAGIYSPSYTAFRNGSYVIEAKDKVGNTVSHTVNITNINTTPFTLLDTFNGLNEEDFTPSTWSAAKAAASELQSLLTVDSAEALVNASSEKLVAALEQLVPRGDGTLASELIERVRTYDQTLYTESSWERVCSRIEELEACLDNPERTQENVDQSRRALEVAVTELSIRGSFTNLDRLISQCEELSPENFDSRKYSDFSAVLLKAKTLSRTDSDQATVDSVYNELLASMNALRETERDGEFDVKPIVFVILGMFVIATCVVLFVSRRRAVPSAGTDSDYDDDYDDYGNYDDETPDDVGDLHFTSDDK